MGEHINRTVRAMSAASLLIGAAAVLSGCSALGVTPGAGASASGPVLDPSIPSASPSASEPIAADATPSPAPPAVTATAAAATSPADTRTAVVPFITTADWDSSASALDVSAIVPTVVEDDGTCTVTLTSGSSVRTATSPGVAASSYTGCQAVEVKDLAAGAWQVRVTYASAKSAGASASRTVQVG